ncbi:C-C motif chemokine 2 [Labeo rohita]|uniref:C-C motif chemokine 2 n=1 Tax=Labeo rohita TaxID=84645 RepID=A0ABQ8L8M6_LABRO|nr:C-C motif chemokine 2 [Labeo rohita]
MRSLLSVLFLMIFCSVQMTSATGLAHAAFSKCCREFSNVQIPVKRVASYSWTSSNCPRRAILLMQLKQHKQSAVCSLMFKTNAGREFCVDPETTWVNHHIDKVDKKKTKIETTTASTAQTLKITV